MKSTVDRSHGIHPILRASIAAAMVLVLVLVNALPSFASSPQKKIKVGGTVTIVNVQGTLWSCGFNPYGATTSLLSAGMIYEPLWYVNQDTNKGTPWLAKGYKFSNGNRKLTFKLRSGIKWTDGKPLTAADVLFTFRLLKRFPGIDVNAIWTVLKGVYAKGNNVVFTFKTPAVPYFYYIADQVFIVPQHTWKKVKDPVTFADSKPMGSGAFKLGSCSPQNITYVRNPHYWQPGKPYLAKVQYPAFTDNTPGNQALASGKDMWGAQYIPNVKSFYLNTGKNRHIWYPPQGYDVIMYPNMKKWPTSILAVRKAISYGLNRNQISRLGVYGYLPPANQTSIILPNFKSWYPKALAAKYGYTASGNTKKAISTLLKAGFKRGSDGIFRDKHGRKLSLQIINIGGYSDWVQEVSIITQNLRSVGIEVTPVNLAQGTHSAREQQGQFQLTYDSPLGGPTPYYQFRQLLYSANGAPIGKTAQSNFERFKSKTVDSWFSQYAATKKASQQHKIINNLAKVMLSQVPVIPVLEGVNWYEYDTNHLAGWPNASNEYAAPAAYNFPDQMVVLTHLHLK